MALDGLDQRRSDSLIPLLLVIMIDCMGFGFIFPVLTPLLIGAHHAVLPHGTTLTISHTMYAVIVAVYPLCMFFGAPVLGDFSDYVGRKRVLLICLIGSALGYVLSGFGLARGALYLVVLGRVVDGLTAGSLSLAQAAIADLSDSEIKQAKYMGLMMFAIALGQVLGPLIAGVFSDVSFASWFSSQLPFYIAGGLSLVNVVWLLYAFRETFQVDRSSAFDVFKTLGSYGLIFKNKALLRVTGIFLCMQICWSFFSQASPVYLHEIFRYSNFQLGLFSSLIGVFIMVGGTFVLPRLLNYLSVEKVAILSLVLMALGILIAVIRSNQILFWSGMVVCTVGAAMAFSCIVTLFSKTVDLNQQGWVMGVSGAVIAFAWGATGLLTGALLHWGVALALYIAIGFALLGSVIIKKIDTNV